MYEKKGFSPVLIFAAIAGAGLVYTGYVMYLKYIVPLSDEAEVVETRPEEPMQPAVSAGSIQLQSGQGSGALPQ